MELSRIRIILVGIAAVFSVGGLWWWALFGMTTEVGMACASTAFIAALGLSTDLYRIVPP